MSKSKTYSLYLVKKDLKDLSGVLTDRAADRIASKSVPELNIDNRLGEKAICYVFQNPLNEPSWIQDLKEVFDDVPLIRNRSSSALVIFKASDRIFISTFGSAWQYINDRAIESDFGLKVTINSLEDGRVKRIDSSHLGEAMKGVSQSAFQRDIQSFGIDEALDQVKRISGRLQNTDFAKNLSGATSLKISREMSFDELGEIAIESLNRYYSDFYKSTSFHIIDKIRPITDRALIDELDESTVDQIKTGTDSFELSMPGWSEDDVVYFGIKGSGLQERFPDLLLSHYREAMQKKLTDLDSDTILNKHGIIAEFNNDIAAKKGWSIKKALIGSISYQGGMYAISEGEWYRLDQQFKNDIDSAMPEITELWPSKPLKIIKKVSDDGKKTGFESELEYNLRCAKQYSQICLDQKIISVPSIPYGKFEACDLLDLENKRLIHVKKSSRQSSVLSHFFKQGSNSARILKTFPEAQNALVSMVEKVVSLEIAEQLKAVIANGFSDWKVEFHIVDTPRSDGDFRIPFFSRISLRDEARMLRGMEFKVALRFIPVAV